VAYRGLVGKWDGHIADLGTITPRMLLHRLEDIFAESRSTGELGKEELAKMAGVVFTSMDEDSSGQIGCSEFIDACTNDGEISLHRMANFFNSKQPKQFARRLFDDTNSEANRMCEKAPSSLHQDTKSLEQDAIDLKIIHADVLDGKVNTEMPRVGREETKDVPPSIVGCEETKDVTPSILAPHNILAEITLVRLEKRMRALELHFEQLLDVLRVSAEPPQMTVRQASRDSGISNGSRIELASNLATGHSSVPDQHLAIATESRWLRFYRAHDCLHAYSI
jgi:Ca2+-binding EF-hand superfamily protein